MGAVKLPGGINTSEWDGFHDLICIDEIARCGYLGVIWALSCGDSIGCPPVAVFGNESQKNFFLPSVINGETRFAWELLNLMVSLCIYNILCSNILIDC
jgi:alkylation response protein AidB-like acyl-CoA dehydrogenase